MKTVNKVTIIGYLGSNVKYQPYGGEGNGYYELSIATNHRIKDKRGNYSEEAAWHTAKVFDSALDLELENLKKGSKVCVEGELRYYSYETKEKVKCKKAIICVKNIIDLSAPQDLTYTGE